MELYFGASSNLGCLRSVCMCTAVQVFDDIVARFRVFIELKTGNFSLLELQNVLSGTGPLQRAVATQPDAGVHACLISLSGTVVMQHQILLLMVSSSSMTSGEGMATI